jgi:hypothetical protein
MRWGSLGVPLVLAVPLVHRFALSAFNNPRPRTLCTEACGERHKKAPRDDGRMGRRMEARMHGAGRQGTPVMSASLPRMSASLPSSAVS